MLMWRVLCLIQFLLLLVVYTYLGLTSSPENAVPMFNDKLMHCSGYFFAGISISFAFPRWSFLHRAAFLIIYSCAIEVGQHFMPPRTFDVLDICANSIGVILGLGLVILLTKIQWFNRLLHSQTK